MKPVILVTGTLLAGLGCAEMIPALYDLNIGNENWKIFAASSVFTTFIGLLMAISARGQTNEINVRQAFMLTAGAWLTLTAFGAVPFTLSSLQLSYSDAFFESMSGITTTGATVITGLDHLPPGLLLWRAELQWLGGLGIIVMAVAVLPILRIGGMQMFKIEAFDTAGKILPRATQISGVLTILYVALTLLCAAAYHVAGMTPFDAVVHAMTTVATGGMSSHDASLGHFDSLHIELICILFMLLGSLPFLLYVRAMQGYGLALLRDAQVRGFLLITFAFVLLAWQAQASTGHEPGLLEFRDAAFAVVSVITGTGYTTVDYGKWGSFAVTLFFIVTFIGGCSGSTSCGIKIFRFQIVFELLRTHARKMIYPNAIIIPSYNGQRVEDGVSQSVMGFLFLFFASFLIISFLLSLHDLDNLTALSATATAMANVGPGLGNIVGPAGNFSQLPDSVKWLLSYAMLLGRLEIYALLVFFMPAFWRS